MWPNDKKHWAKRLTLMKHCKEALLCSAKKLMCDVVAVTHQIDHIK